jgi:hypothetical protein
MSQALNDAVAAVTAVSKTKMQSSARAFVLKWLAAKGGPSSPVAATASAAAPVGADTDGAPLKRPKSALAAAGGAVAVAPNDGTEEAGLVTRCVAFSQHHCNDPPMRYDLREICNQCFNSYLAVVVHRNSIRKFVPFWNMALKTCRNRFLFDILRAAKSNPSEFRYVQAPVCGSQCPDLNILTLDRHFKWKNRASVAFRSLYPDTARETSSGSPKQYVLSLLACSPACYC